MVTSSSDYSSSSSDEDSRIPLAKARANMDHAKKTINGMSLDELKAARDELLKRKDKEEITAEYREKKPSDSDPSDVEEEPWEPEERRSRLYPPHREIEWQVKDDLQAACDEEDYLDAIYGDVEEEFPDDSDSDSEKESGEDSSEDDDDDDDDESDDFDD
ncbi:uncharacterized protein LOC113295167 [Papaver somniferum]|uniref:uncharacterized protein LOC113295167 n=1 Tax=Papaver somniferum TaxID=3469 RepID=UPI000E6FC6A3|nr:uncharacterized protein LOC113295167 [Papaver somniferum]